MKRNVNERNLEHLTFGGPATYRIRIKGRLDEHWSDRLGGMTITTSKVGDQKPVTTLAGPLLDQAALLGVLNALYDLHLPLFSVECLGKEPEE
jgi:hypothetical protein